MHLVVNHNLLTATLVSITYANMETAAHKHATKLRHYKYQVCLHACPILTAIVEPIYIYSLPVLLHWVESAM